MREIFYHPKVSSEARALVDYYAAVSLILAKISGKN